MILLHFRSQLDFRKTIEIYFITFRKQSLGVATEVAVGERTEGVGRVVEEKSDCLRVERTNLSSASSLG